MTALDCRKREPSALPSGSMFPLFSSSSFVATFRDVPCGYIHKRLTGNTGNICKKQSRKKPLTTLLREALDKVKRSAETLLKKRPESPLSRATAPLRRGMSRSYIKRCALCQLTIELDSGRDKEVRVRQSPWEGAIFTRYVQQLIHLNKP